MFLHKKAARAVGRRLKANVSLDFGSNESDLRNSLNVEKDGNGITSSFKRKIQVVSGVPKKFVGTNGNVLYYTTDKGIYTLENNVRRLILDACPTEVAGCVFRSNFYLSGTGIGTNEVANDITPKSVSNRYFTSMAVCSDRIFGLYANEVRYCEAGIPNNWEYGEMLVLPERCDALIAVDGKVYVLGNTCYTLTPHAEHIEFKFSRIAHNLGAVAKYSVLNYNGCGVFASSNGLFKISSGKITPIFTQLNDLLDFSRSASAFFKGKWYLTCRTKSSSGIINDVTLKLDLDKEEVEGVLEYGFEVLAATPSVIYGLRNEEFHSFAQDTSLGRFVKSGIDFATDEKKFLDRLSVTTLHDLDVKIRSENETRLYKVKGKNSLQKINLRDMGWEFSIELSSDAGLSVKNLTLEAHTSKEE